MTAVQEQREHGNKWDIYTLFRIDIYYIHFPPPIILQILDILHSQHETL